MKLSVIIVNYNVKYFLGQCLHSLYLSLKDIDAEVIVVDNASKDESEEYIKELFPEVIYIYNKNNVGFAKANNQAIKIARGEYVLLLNPDTIVPELHTRQVLDFMDNNPDAGACGVKMLSPNGQYLRESKRGYPSPMASFWKLTGTYKLFPNNPYFNTYYLSYLDKEEVHEVPVLAGAYMMIRKSSLEQSGYLDEDFFMYGEDIDLSCRLEMSGDKNYYLPYSILHYKGESTTKESYKYVRVFYGAMGIFFKKHGNKYSKLSRLLVYSGLYLQTYLKLSFVFIRRTLSRIHKTQTHTPYFIIFASKTCNEEIFNILNKNGLGERCRFIDSNNNLKDLSSLSNKVTHIIYDKTLFSYDEILSKLEGENEHNTQLGVYNPYLKAIITPGECYT